MANESNAQLKQKITDLEKQLETYREQIKALHQACGDMRTERDELALKNQELLEEAQKLRNTGGPPSENPFSTVPLDVQVSIASQCLGVLRNRLNGGPMEPKDFEIEAPELVRQALALKDMFLDQFFPPQSCNDEETK